MSEQEQGQAEEQKGVSTGDELVTITITVDQLTALTTAFQLAALPVYPTIWTAAPEDTTEEEYKQMVFSLFMLTSNMVRQNLAILGEEGADNLRIALGRALWLSIPEAEREKQLAQMHEALGTIGFEAELDEAFIAPADIN